MTRALHRLIPLALACVVAGLAPLAQAQTTPAAAAPAGSLKGSARVHDAASAQAVVDRAQVALPAAVTGGAPHLGPYKDAPKAVKAKAPVVLFLHGSSGLGLKAIAEWQQWLADQGIASFAPDSFGLPERITYTSPIDKDTYEAIHSLRASEIAIALKALQAAPWADASRIVLAGTSEGATAVAREDSAAFAGRMIFAWSCEANYFVKDASTAMAGQRPVLNIISLTDPFFSPANTWLGNPAAKGHCGEAFKAHKAATVVLLAQAPHTLLNLPAARSATAGFLREVFGPAR